MHYNSIIVVIIVKIIFLCSFLLYCLLYNHSFKTNPNSTTNLSKLFNYTAPASLFHAFLGYLDHPPRICVSNVHIFWDPSFADVKLWQTHILIKELQKFTQARGLPLVLGGDFNSEPKSSVHELLGTASVSKSK